MGDRIFKQTYVVVDIETTGLSRDTHKITEIAAHKLKGARFIDTYTTLVNPECRIPRFITRLTGIDDRMVKDAPIIKKVIPDFREFLGNNTFVAHNAWFDYGFLDVAFRKNAHTFLTNDVICTCRLARKLLPDLPRKNLPTICEHFNLENTRAHRASEDALVTSKIFTNFLNILSDNGIKEYKDLLLFQSGKLGRKNASAGTFTPKINF